MSFAQTPSETPKKSEEKIHYGDLIDVDVIGSTEYDWRGTVTPEGFLSGIEFIEEPVYALCRTETEIARQIEKGYEKLLREPKVEVKILDRSGRPLSLIYGAVKIPQRLRIERPVKLNELIILSGGFTERTGGEIQILRPKQLSCDSSNEKHLNDEIKNEGTSRERFVTTRTESGTLLMNIRITDLLAGKPDSNPQIVSGDIITILEAEPIYVIGGVGNPAQISSRSKLTVSRAIASAGGLLKDADEKEITIYRRTKNETEIIQANLQEITAGKSEDITLKPFDIIEVPRKGAGKRKFPPVLRTAEIAQSEAPNLPLRVIN